MSELNIPSFDLGSEATGAHISGFNLGSDVTGANISGFNAAGNSIGATLRGLPSFSFDMLVVNPEVMLQKSDAVLSKINEMKREFDELEMTVNKTKTYWIGEAGDAHRNYYEKQKPSIEEIFKRLMEHVQDLKDMSAVYSNVEQEVKDMAADLPSDVIL